MPDHCEKCHNAIHDTTITFDKKKFHPECFVCHQCRKQLSGKSIYTHEEHYYDQDCYKDFHAKKCAVCYEACISAGTKYVTYDGKTYHAGCFLCNGTCGKSLQGTEFFIVGDKKFCKDCHDN